MADSNQEQGQQVSHSTQSNDDRQVDASKSGSAVDPEVIEQEKVKQVAEHVVRAGFGISIQQSSGLSTELIQKLTPEHISKGIEIADNDSKRGFIYAIFNKIINALVLVAILIFLVYLARIFDMDQYKEILGVIIIGVSAAFGGYGFGKTRSNQ